MAGGVTVARDPLEVVAGQQRRAAGARALHQVGVVTGAAARALEVGERGVRHPGSLCRRLATQAVRGGHDQAHCPSAKAR